ncbi:unnamed protein product [Phytophthora fragariaefolia]|uniref:Unnamed protein product n=1 Tax=Phytophthora fragariaefolia TaxID=1490495 RepID=A0A9W6YLN1_9STRA|nr:unnamed protein product [Phytophthora fragariaefolia]
MPKFLREGASVREFVKVFGKTHSEVEGAYDEEAGGGYDVASSVFDKTESRMNLDHCSTSTCLDNGAYQEVSWERSVVR